MVDWRVNECMQRLRQTLNFVVDVETSGLDWKKNHIVGYVFTFGSAPDDTFYLPVRHTGGGNIGHVKLPGEVDGWTGDVTLLEKEIAKILNQRQDYIAIGHHLGFDLRFMHRVGVDLGGAASCTMVNAALLNELARSFSLAACAEAAGTPKKKGVDLYKYMAEKFGDEPNKKQMGNYWRTDPRDPIVHQYAMQDGTSTWDLWRWQQKQLHVQNLSRVYAVECKMVKVLTRMTTHGIKIDEERLHEVQKIVQIREKAALMALPKDFNTRSSKEVKELFTSHDLTDWPTTMKGNASFTKEWLNKSEIGKNIVKAREYAHLNDSFITPMLERHLHKGRVHAEYNQLRGDEYGTITGRLSSSNPNLQQAHKRNEELGRLYRSIFIPDGDMIWGSRDWNQCEPRLLAYYSRCKVLFDGYLADPPTDAHAAVAKASNVDRETGKRLNQAMLTGAGVKKIAEMLSIDHKSAEKLVDKYFSAMPEILMFRKKASQRMAGRGYVLSLLGRRARLEPGRAYKALNRLLQCGNADMIKLKMVECDEYLRAEGGETHMLNSIHDALDFQFFPECASQYEKLGEIMTAFGEDDVIHLDIPITVDSKEGENWAIATYGEEDV